jgi:hypothetical protein
MKLRKVYNDGGEIASTILEQLGGANRLHAMTGAYNFINLGNGLSFKIKNQKANYIKITLTSMDLYDIEVGRIRGFTYKVVAEGKGLYAEELKRFIEKATGMYLSFGRYDKGGNIEKSIKQRLSKSFELPLQMAVYVPSTKDKNVNVTKKEMDERVLEVKSFLANLFGGFNSVKVEGGFESSDKGLIEEDAVRVVAFANQEGFEVKFEKLVSQIKNWCREWSQESIGLEFENDLFYIESDSKYADGGMITVTSDDGEVLKYKIDTDEKSIEVDALTKQYLSDIVLVMNRDFRKLNEDLYIFWYDEMSDEDIKELEEVFQTSFTKFAKGGLFATGITSKREIEEQIKRLRKTKEAQKELEEELKSGNLSDYEIDLIENQTLPDLYGDEVHLINNLKFLIKKYNIEHDKELAIPKNLYVFMKAQGFANGGEMEDDTFVMLFKAYGFVEKRGSYGTRTFYNTEHNAKIYYDPKYRNISGYVGGGEGNDEVIPYSVDGVLDFFIEHDITESESTPLAKGGETDKPFFRDRTAKLREPFNKGFEGLAKATGNEALTKVGKMASGGNVWDEDLNVYTLVSSKEYFGSDTASDKRRWFRRNGRGLTRDQAKRMAQDYIDRYGKERVYIGNIRHYR